MLTSECCTGEDRVGRIIGLHLKLTDLITNYLISGLYTQSSVPVIVVDPQNIISFRDRLLLTFLNVIAQCEQHKLPCHPICIRVEGEISYILHLKIKLCMDRHC